MAKNKKLAKDLLHWHRHFNKRMMPWKGEKNPYKIWLSEIILQQTRVEQGLAYYNKFVTKYPNIQSLANAKDDDVFKLWEGLGYYSRCRNLLHAAREVAEKYNAVFPDKYNDILSLKGIGSYTAAAIASFAYNQPYAVLDGNVYRVLSRVFAIDLAIDSNEGKKYFTALSQSLIDVEQPALYNQAIMDLGATVCKPQQPICDACPLQKMCKAYHRNSISKYPFKEKKLTVTTRWFYYLVLQHSNNILIQKRTVKDIWQNLHEFYLVETQQQQDVTKTSIKKWLKENLNYLEKFEIKSISKEQQQKLTHRTIKGNFIGIELTSTIDVANHFWINKKDISTYSFPRFINTYLENTNP
ncbi:MAG: A/G-specific adenine glycosylase [Chitinophagaceae bacterium]